MRTLRLAVFLVACVVSAGTAYAQPQRLVFVGNADYPPYQYLDAQGQPRGFNVELIRALARETRITIDIRLERLPTVLPIVERGEADLVSLAFTTDRADRFTWLLPLWRLRQVALFRQPPRRPVTSVRDLIGERVVAFREGVLWEDLQSLPENVRPAIVEAAGPNYYSNGARLLRDGKASVLLGNALQLRAQHVYRDYPQFHEVTLRSFPYYLAAAPGRESLVPIFFEAFSRLQESGEFSAIVERTLLAPSVRPWWDGWVVYLTGSLGVAALALFGFIAWNRSLRSQVDTRTAEIRAVAERLAFHGHVLSQVSDAIIVLTPDRRLTCWNAGAEALFGIPASEAIGRSAEDVLDRLASADDLKTIRHTVAQSGAFRGELIARRQDGNPVHVEAIVQELRDVQGRPAGRIILVHDIHDLKLAERERRQLEQHLQQVQKLESLGVLAGGIAHDFNNLLVGMLGHAGLALSEIPPGSPLRERIQQIETCALRAAELTNQMLAYSGKGRCVVEPTDLTLVVREMSNLLETAISKGARLDLHLAEPLPAMLADRTQLRQVVMNLITNASDAIGAGVGTITVTTGTMIATREYLAQAYTSGSSDAGEYVFLEVRDTGCGMDAETQQRIFDPFFTTKFSGRGLGLAAVLGIVRGHRGVVRIQSAPGTGTTFRILFPASAGVVALPASKPEHVGARKHARVLVVDDESSVRAIAREALSRAGFTVLVAEDGPEAVERVKDDHQSIDAVLMDMTMPGMNGVDAMRAMRHLVPGLPVVITSGYSEQEAQERCGDDTFTGFVQKPFAPSALVAKINDAVAP
jgi:PAS domain S-box-containing protein